MVQTRKTVAAVRTRKKAAAAQTKKQAEAAQTRKMTPQKVAHAKRDRRGREQAGRKGKFPGSTGNKNFPFGATLTEKM
jgi:hypothetical protein